MITRTGRMQRCTLLLLCTLMHLALTHAGPAPPGRTAIKINTEVPKVTPPPSRSNTGGGGGRNAPPVLFRQPHAVVPPPFLQVDVALSAMDGAGANAAGAAGGDETVFASYYGEPESEQGGAAAEGFVAGSVPGGSADSAGAAMLLDEFGYPLRGATSFVQGGPSEQLAAWTELSGQCWTYASASYVYSFCPYQNVTQKSTSTTLHVVLGVWDSWIETESNNDAAKTTATSGTAAAATTTTEAPTPAAASTNPASAASAPAPASTANAATGFQGGSLMQLFTDGTACGNGKRRSTKVLFLCDPLAEDGGRISDVKEPATCEYTIKFHTGLVCDREAIAVARGGHVADAVASGSDSSSSPPSSSEHSVLQSMQRCITLLFQSAYPSDDLEIPRHQDILSRCRNFLPADARQETFGEEDRGSASGLATNRGAAAGAAASRPAVAAAAAVASADASSDLSSLVSPAAAATPTPAAPTRANIPSSIISDPDAPVSASHSNAVEPEEELNVDFTLEASSSPYAELDDRDQ